jgi:hypothetical protein
LQKTLAPDESRGYIFQSAIGRDPVVIDHLDCGEQAAIFERFNAEFCGAVVTTDELAAAGALHRLIPMIKCGGTRGGEVLSP